MAAPHTFLGRKSVGLTTGLLLLIAVVTTLAAVLELVRAVFGADGAVPVTVSHPVPPPGLPAGSALVDPESTGWLQVDGLPWWLRLFAVSGTALGALSVAVGALALAQVLRAVRSGQPFGNRTPTWIGVVAVAVVVGGSIAPMLEGLAGMVVLVRAELQDAGLFDFTFEIRLAPMLVGVLSLAVAEAFRRGAALSDDVDGLV